MIKDIFKWAKCISEGWKVFFGLVGMVSVISFTAVKIDHLKNRKINQSVRIDKWIEYDSLEHEEGKYFRISVMTKLSILSDSLRAVNDNVRLQSAVNSNMKDYMMRKVATKDGVMEVLQVFNVEKKNFGLSFYRTPSGSTLYGPNLKSDMKK